MMKHRKFKFILFILFFLLTIFFFIYSLRWIDEQLINAPKIKFDLELKSKKVKYISFERNYLYLNDTLYNAGGISSQSRVHSPNGIILLQDIKPPFMISKKKDNDTLKINKNNIDFYLLLTEEVKYDVDNL